MQKKRSVESDNEFRSINSLFFSLVDIFHCFSCLCPFHSYLNNETMLLCHWNTTESQMPDTPLLVNDTFAVLLNEFLFMISSVWLRLSTAVSSWNGSCKNLQSTDGNVRSAWNAPRSPWTISQKEK